MDEDEVSQLSDAEIDRRLSDLAESIADGLTWDSGFVFGDLSDFEKQGIYGGDDEWTHYSSCQIYGSNQGPSLDTIVEEDLFDEDEREQLDFSGWSLADELMGLCNNGMLDDSHPKCVEAFVTMEDNCLWAYWLFDGDPREA